MRASLEESAVLRSLMVGFSRAPTVSLMSAGVVFCKFSFSSNDKAVPCPFTVVAYFGPKA